MKYADTWYQHDFCRVLTKHNPTKGDECFFNDLVYHAQKAGCFDPIKIPRIGDEDLLVTHWILTNIILNINVWI